MSEGITFIQTQSFKAIYMIFISFPCNNIRNKTFPNAGLIKPYKKWMRFIIPVIEISYNTYIGCIWSPYSKISSRCIEHSELFIAKQFVQTVMIALLKIVYILFSK